MFRPPNDTFSNVNKPLYIARKKSITYDDYNNEIVEYHKPFRFISDEKPININYQPLNWKSLQSYMSVYGETKSNVVQALIDYTYENTFKEFDLAYLYGVTPKGEKVYGENANYIVKAFRKQNTKILVIFEEIIKNNETEEINDGKENQSS